MKQLWQIAWTAVMLAAIPGGLDARGGDTGEAIRVPAIQGPSPQQIRDSMARGVRFLLADQNADGSWGSPHRTKDLNIYAPVPGAHHAFQAAVTSLCVAALIELEKDFPEASPAIDRGERWLLEFLPRVRRANATALYNVWTHAYSIQALVRMMERHQGDAAMEESIRSLIGQQIDLLDRYESVDGGWGYYDFRAGTQRPASDSTSFTTATALIALHEARQAGIEPPEPMVRRAIASIQRQRKPDFSYLYGEYLKYSPMADINRPGGSLGRSQVCNAALRLWGDTAVTDQVVIQWLHRLFARNGWLDMGRKRPVPHESWFQVAGYFFYYGHYYAARCIEMLPARERPFFQAHLADVLVKRQEKDGSWWDFPLYNYHQQYGTAFALMALKRCLPAAEGSAPPSGP